MNEKIQEARLEDLVKAVENLTDAVYWLNSSDIVQVITECNETLKDYCSLLREQREWKVLFNKNEY